MIIVRYLDPHATPTRLACGNRVSEARFSSRQAAHTFWDAWIAHGGLCVETEDVPDDATPLLSVIGGHTVATYDTPSRAGDYAAQVVLFTDGSASVYLNGVMVARKDVTGRVELAADGTVEHNAVEDSFVSTPLTPYVLGVVENRARDFAARARRQLRRVATAHRTGRNGRFERTAAEVAPDA